MKTPKRALWIGIPIFLFGFKAAFGQAVSPIALTTNQVLAPDNSGSLVQPSDIISSPAIFTAQTQLANGTMPVQQVSAPTAPTAPTTPPTVSGQN